MEGATESQPRAWLMDMDGVLVHEEEPVPGADRRRYPISIPAFS
jgi:ribonucleotide monophosphatase NagD (HAD superfamily)